MTSRDRVDAFGTEVTPLMNEAGNSRGQNMKFQLQQKIQDILDQCVDMTVATVGSDVAPQATVVSFVCDGLIIYFVCGASSQKAVNITHDPRVAVTMTPPYGNWDEIEGLSIAGTAEAVTDAKEMSEIGGLINWNPLPRMR
jgi:general stress protein 26